MSFMIQDRLEVALYFNDIEYSLKPGENTLNFLHMGASTRFRLPSIHLSVIDMLHSLDTLNLQDGLKIRVTIKRSQENTETYNFRKFNHQRSGQGGVFSYVMDGYLDFPQFWSGTSAASINGTSGDALSKIASTCGLKYDGITTSDPQLWLQRNQTYSKFARTIEASAYIDDQSYMKWGVQFDGTLTYRNLSNLGTATIKLVARQVQSDALTVVDYAAATNSGLTNAVSGYNSTQQEQSMLGESKSNASIDFQSDSRSPMVSTTVKEAAAHGDQSFAPLDFGNVHPKSARAVYQNQRYAGLLNTDVEFLFMEPTTMKLMQPFTFAADSQDLTQDAAFSGDYAISGQAIYIRGGDYFEKVVGTRHGTNLQYVAA